MSNKLIRLLGEGPYPFLLEETNRNSSAQIYNGGGAVIVSSPKGIDFFEGKHVHKSFEFVVPMSAMPDTYVEKRIKELEVNKLLPFNSEQAHGPAGQLAGCRLIGIHIDEQIIRETSYDICGKNNVSFKNESVIFSSELNNLVQLFISECSSRQTGSEFILENMANIMSAHLARQLQSNLPKLPAERSYCERDSINRIIAYMTEYYNKEYSMKDVACIANLSPYHLIRSFKAATGKTPYDLKVEKAGQMLRNRGNTVTEVCYLSGFNNLGHFASVFKRKMGVLPSQYKKAFM